MASLSSSDDQQPLQRTTSTTATTEQQHKEVQDPTNMKRQKRSAVAKRRLRSLGLAVDLSLFLTLMDIALFGFNIHYTTVEKPFWYPPRWAMHSACWFLHPSLGCLPGCSGLRVEGGFHRDPTALLLCLGAVVLGLPWDPIVCRPGANKVGLVVRVLVYYWFSWGVHEELSKNTSNCG